MDGVRRAVGATGGGGAKRPRSESYPERETNKHNRQLNRGTGAHGFDGGEGGPRVVCRENTLGKFRRGSDRGRRTRGGEPRLR